MDNIIFLILCVSGGFELPAFFSDTFQKFGKGFGKCHNPIILQLLCDGIQVDAQIGQFADLRLCLR